MKKEIKKLNEKLEKIKFRVKEEIGKELDTIKKEVSRSRCDGISIKPITLLVALFLLIAILGIFILKELRQNIFDIQSRQDQDKKNLMQEIENLEAKIGASEKYSVFEKEISNIKKNITALETTVLNHDENHENAKQERENMKSIFNNHSHFYYQSGFYNRGYTLSGGPKLIPQNSTGVIPDRNKAENSSLSARM